MPLKSLFLFLFVTICSFATSELRAQGIVPTLDFNNFFVSFQDGFFRPIEIQPIVSYKAGDEMVAYIDTRGNLKLYDGKQRVDVTTLNVDYQVSDHLMAYRIASGSAGRTCWNISFRKLFSYLHGIRDFVYICTLNREARMAELVDAHDSKSCVLVTCGFDSHSGYREKRREFHAFFYCSRIR